MNWTGGRLQRHSAVTGSVKNRQRQHFAKVQQNLRNRTNKFSPIKWSIFDLVVEDPNQGLQSSTTSGRVTTKPNRKSQSFLSGHPNLMASRSPTHKNSGQNMPHSIGLVVKQKHQAKPFVQEHVPDRSLYDATPPPPPPPKRKRAASERAVSELASDRVDSTGQTSKDDSLLEKRRKILEQGDWAGVDIQKPLKLAFALPEHEEDIGKRRRVARNQHAQFRDSRTCLASPFLDKKQPRGVCNPDRERKLGQLTKSDVRISIGDRVVPPGISSSSLYQNDSHSTMDYRRSHTVSSDVMLLDNDQAQVQETFSIIDTSCKYDSKQSSSITYETLHYKRIGTMPVERRHMLTTLPCDIQTEQEHIKIYSKSKDNLRECYGSFDKHLSNHRAAFEPGTSSANDLSTQSPEKNNCQGRLIFSSPSASIQHPKPQSSRVSVLVSSEPSDVWDSTAAQLGQIISVAPSSENLDNEIWATWMASESDEIDFRVVDYNQSETCRASSVSISPGLSMVPPKQSRGVFIDGNYVESDSEIQNSPCKEMVGELSLSRSPSRNSSIDYLLEVQIKRDSGISLQPTAELQVDVQSNHVKDHRTSIPQLKSQGKEIIMKDGSWEDDSDNIWRKFVFDNGDHEEADITPGNEDGCSSKGLDFTKLSNVTQLATVQSSNPTSSIRTATTYCPNVSSTSQHVSHFTQRPSHWGLQAAINRDNTAISNFLLTSVAAQTASGYDSRLSETNKSSKSKRRRVLSTRPAPFIGHKVMGEYITKESHIRRGVEINLGRRTSRKTKNSDILVPYRGRSDEDMDQIDIDLIEDD